MKKMLLGIGNRLRSDDAAGNILVDRMRHSEWYVVDGADIPENFTGVIRREKPDLLVVVDATDIGESPGTIRRVPVNALSDETGFNTHTGPLTGLLSRLINYSKDLVFIGIQPASVDFGEDLSPEAAEAVERLLDILLHGSIDDIPQANNI